ncbi:flagellar hook assembly protein FlgD [Rheinheimera muenzenbergensis]|uniref:Basal-body rod modification protein FlgD n=1 Tax=Rheinheimera muenzenbergensis TaxID=1193628 RepID=A0ABU8C210_9GAMM|nr:flagellar hook assembly protein FlgD [Gammaproteobacteria bacterium]MBU1556150.1 flagellar hook assembly protein FlgD [Gammaproteobacteria bacterium]MBU2069356.1 flagellar hook assembly protein FlgD [Gammaproteobacteria bacterium]MBU2183409.1 flagellar hook assembly protein FlgD [Gammaproteobacteria bacterium]MBU2204566.1 flagellar hook assembly protein FlgD [Gammaproteobacteria bacterium]
MTTGVNNNSALDGMYWDNGKKTPDKNNGALTQADFFALLTQQLAYQDPTKPVENDQMIAQMTNFTMADGIGSLNESFKGLAQSMTSNQALQASSLVGRTVLTQSDEIVFTGETLSRGNIELDKAATLMKVRIENEKGELVQSFSVENPQVGKNEFIWDGTYMPSGAGSAAEVDGEVSDRVKAGVYKVKVDVSYADGTNASLPVNVYTPVGSVSLNGQGGSIMLNLLGLGQVKLSDVLEVSYS